jgi:hypothetical protein
MAPAKRAFRLHVGISMLDVRLLYKTVVRVKLIYGYFYGQKV